MAKSKAREAEPYFDGQIPGPCGCYYPDVQREKDESRLGGGVIRTYRCKNHGCFTIERPEIDYQAVKRTESTILPPVDLSTL